MRRQRRVRTHVVRHGLLATALAVVAAGPAIVSAGPSQARDPGSLFLVTLTGAGTSGSESVLPPTLQALAMEGAQDAVLATVGAPAPAYRWTTALDGVAVTLTGAQARQLAGDPRIALVERDRLRPVAGVDEPVSGAASRGGVGSGRVRGGAGEVIGVVDTGLAGDSPLFAPVPGLGRLPADFHGGCAAAVGLVCNGKILAAAAFVRGFDASHARPAGALTAVDDDGHGTLVASIAAGDAAVPVRVRGQRLGSYAGQAPQARLAVYKACWTAPDPRDDGCSTADVVTAVDRATADGVNVLNLSLGTPRGPGPVHDTLDRALLGATEAGIVVVSAAGTGRTIDHASPWVTTVGATAGAVRSGQVHLGSGPALRGAMSSLRGVGPARLVLGSRVPAPGRSVRAARICRPGSLDAARVAGRVVLCLRGGVGRVDKSEAVQQADGVGMVLVNPGPGSVDADFQAVPTVHLDAAAGRRLIAQLRAHPDASVRLRPLGIARQAPRVTSWSPSGRTGDRLVEPDLVAPGTGLVGAVPGSPGWDQLTGTSASAAYTSGVAALLLQQRAWSATRVRSALATSSAAVPGAGVLRAGAGEVRAVRAARPGLVYDLAPSSYRAWLDHDVARLNTPSIVIPSDRSLATRVVTNVGRRALYFSSSTQGFRGAVIVTPAALRLAPGESATYTVRVIRAARRGPADDGWVLWRGATGTVTRTPVLIRR